MLGRLHHLCKAAGTPTLVQYPDDRQATLSLWTDFTAYPLKHHMMLKHAALHLMGVLEAGNASSLQMPIFTLKRAARHLHCQREWAAAVPANCQRLRLCEGELAWVARSATYAQMGVLVAPMADPSTLLLRSTFQADLQVTRQGVVSAACGCLWHCYGGIAAKLARSRPDG